ncbi:MAG TPA: hypothetical protein DDZ51_14820 [Planctomycetaceae bacterium]|nr:hypothetical protein [Planctomycetaceae bacterium]
MLGVGRLSRSGLPAYFPTPSNASSRFIRITKKQSDLIQCASLDFQILRRSENAEFAVAMVGGIQEKHPRFNRRRGPKRRYIPSERHSVERNLLHWREVGIQMLEVQLKQGVPVVTAAVRRNRPSPTVEQDIEFSVLDVIQKSTNFVTKNAASIFRRQRFR